LAIKCPKCQFDNPNDTIYCGKCAAPLHPDQPAPTRTMQMPSLELSAGKVFAGRYEVVEELGRGGMGRVYKVLDKQINEEIALKLLKPEIAADGNMIERFRNELKIARKITHKNVCRMHDINEEEGAPYITMEYVAGVDLKSLVKSKGKLSKEETIGIAKQVCEGLAEAHELGVVHRDLKPQNIMIDEKGYAKIMDFGIARSVEAPGVTQTGVMIGTPDYISPEQAEGKEADQRSDIYSLGVILYEMVTGSVPFKGDTAFSVALKHKVQLPQDPKKINPEVLDNLSRLILICMEKERERRYQTTEELLTDLKNIEEGYPLGTKIQPRRKTFISTLIRKKVFIPALVLALALIVVAVWQLLPQKEISFVQKIENSIAIISFENQTGDEKYDYMQKVIPNLLITNIENTGLFHVVTWERMRDILKQIGEEDFEIIDQDLGFEVCRREGVQAIALGSFSKAGDVFVTDVKVLDVETKNILRSESARGNGEESIFNTQIDALSKAISLSLGAGMNEVESSLTQVKDITTHSLEAYRYFLNGREAFWFLYWDEARQWMEKALEIDPTFTLASLYLVWAYNFLADFKSRDETLEKAKVHMHKTSEKNRLYFEADYAIFIEQDYDKHFRSLQELIGKYPRERRALHYLGDYLFIYELKYAEAIVQFKKALELNPNDASMINHVAHASVYAEDYEQTKEYIELHSTVSPPDPYNLFIHAYMFTGMGDFSAAQSKYEELLAIKPDYLWGIFSLSYLHALKEDYQTSFDLIEDSITKSTTSGEVALGYFYKGNYHYWLGEFDKALIELNRAEELAEEVENVYIQIWAEWMKGVNYLEKRKFALSTSHFQKFSELGQKFFPNETPYYKGRYVGMMGFIALKQGKIEEAKLKLDEIKPFLTSIVRPSKQDLIYILDYLQGEIYLAEGSPDKAISVLEPLRKLNKQPVVDWNLDEYQRFLRINPNDALARAYENNGEVEKAITEFEKLLSPSVDASFMPYLIHPTFHYNLARLYEKTGQIDEAKEHYEKFLSLWKDADPGIDEGEDARKSLAGLKE